MSKFADRKGESKMDYNYNPMSYMNPYPNTNMPTYRNPVPTLPGPQLDKVNGIDSARAFPMKSNSQIALFDANEDIMYIKTTDANNFATIRRFRFVEEPEQPIQPVSGFVTKEEFDAFKEEILNGKQFIRNTKPTNGKRKSNEPGTTADQKHDADGSK